MSEVQALLSEYSRPEDFDNPTKLATFFQKLAAATAGDVNNTVVQAVSAVKSQYDLKIQEQSNNYDYKLRNMKTEYEEKIEEQKEEFEKQIATKQDLPNRPAPNPQSSSLPRSSPQAG